MSTTTAPAPTGNGNGNGSTAVDRAALRVLTLVTAALLTAWVGSAMLTAAGEPPLSTARVIAGLAGVAATVLVLHRYWPGPALRGER